MSHSLSFPTPQPSGMPPIGDDPTAGKLATMKAALNADSTTDVDAATDVDAPPATMPPAVSLSPQALMAYCQAQLDNLDTQMDTIFTQEQSNNQLTTAVNNVASALNDLPAPASATASTITLGNSGTQVANAYQNAINEANACDDPQLANSLSDDLASWNANASGGAISASSLSQLTSSLKNYVSDLNSDSQLTMINLQQLMSQRETAVQLTTNLVQSLGDQASDVAKNIGQ